MKCVPCTLEIIEDDREEQRRERERATSSFSEDELPSHHIHLLIMSAESFKEKGNECFKRGDFEAVSCTRHTTRHLSPSLRTSATHLATTPKRNNATTAAATADSTHTPLCPSHSPRCILSDAHAVRSLLLIARMESE